MTDLTVTVSSETRVFGGAPTNKWGTFLWGQNWAYGNLKISTTIDYSSIISDSISLSDDLTKSFSKIIDDTIGLADHMIDISMKDAAGYSYQFSGAVSDFLDKITTTYSAVGRRSTSWTGGSSGVTTWTDV